MLDQLRAPALVPTTAAAVTPLRALTAAAFGATAAAKAPFPLSAALLAALRPWLALAAGTTPTEAPLRAPGLSALDTVVGDTAFTELNGAASATAAFLHTLVPATALPTVLWTIVSAARASTPGLAVRPRW